MARHHHLHRRHDVDQAHAAHQPRDARPEPVADPATVVSVVYVTASATFDGPVAGYTTLGDPVSQPSATTTRNYYNDNNNGQRTDNHKTQLTPETQSPGSQTSNASSVQATPDVQIQSPSDVSTSHRWSTTTFPSSDTALRASSLTGMVSVSTASVSSLRSSGNVELTSSATEAVPSSTASADSSAKGMTTGARAGLALGLLFGLCAIVGLLYFCLRRKKKKAGRGQSMADHEEKPTNGIEDDTGMAGRASSVRTARTTSTAPRLSLRPVTQFDPNLAGERGVHEGKNPPSQATTNAAPAGHRPQGLTVPAVAAAAMASPTSPASHASPHNPFGAHAETLPAPNTSMAGSGIATAGASNRTTVWPTPPSSRSENDRGMANGGINHGSSSGPGIGATVVAAATAANPAPAHPCLQTPVNSDRSGHVQSTLSTSTIDTQSVAVAPFDSNASPHSSFVAPSGTPRMMHGSMDSTLAAAPVHRVQLDFNPSMEDELELRAGQLVRLLHEYDDGWALCVRLDRSEQGVAPRTCLSVTPVKPKPLGGPTSLASGHLRSPYPPSTWPAPQGPNSRSASPSAGRQSPIPYSPFPPRPLSPAPGRRTPGSGDGRSGSPSPATIGGRGGGVVAATAAPYYASPRYRVSPSPSSRSASPAGEDGLRSSMSPVRSMSPQSISSRSGTPSGQPDYHRASPLGQHGQGPPAPLQRLPTVLRSGSPLPSSHSQSRPSSPAPARKPVPGQAF